MEKYTEQILFTSEQIEERVGTLADEIVAYYGTEEELVLIGVMNGAIMFSAALIRELGKRGLNVLFDTMSVSSYGKSQTSSGSPKIIYEPKIDIKNKNTLVVEDLLDKGFTAQAIFGLLATYYPSSVDMAVLLEKDVEREVDVAARFVGFKIPGDFVYGYGIDVEEYRRSLPEIWRQVVAS